MSQLRLLTYDEPEAFYSLSPIWMSLLDRIEHKNPFLTPHWIGLNYMYFFKEGNLRIYLLFENTEPLGIMPLAYFQDNDYFFIFPPISYHVTDYFDVVVENKWRKPFLEMILEDIKGLTLGKEFVLDLLPVLSSSPTPKVLEIFSEEKSLKFEKQELTRAPYVELNKSFDDYLLRLNSKDRHELRRKVLKAERKLDLDLEVLSSPREINENFEHFFNLFRKSSIEKKKFLTPEIEAFFYEVFVLLSQNNWLKLFFLKSGNKRISTFLVIDYANTYYIYNSGYDPDYGEYSPGTVLLFYIIEDAIKNGKVKVDFLRGKEKYKYKLGAKDVSIYRILVFNSDFPKVRPIVMEDSCSSSFT